jgi:site-specific DNA-methyltransferase (cytosine-N4-specific)
MLAQLERQTDPKVIGLLRLSMDDILMRIASEDRHTSGLALEALAFKLMRSLEMDYKSTRLRAAVTGGAEVDLIFESTRLVFSRWQVQCKNTARVSLDDVAKEVGLTHLLKSSVIVVVTTGRVGDEARRYADRIMKDSNLSIVMLEGRDLDRIATQPAYIVDVFSREARHASGIKILDLAK